MFKDVKNILGRVYFEVEELFKENYAQFNIEFIHINILLLDHQLDKLQDNIILISHNHVGGIDQQFVLSLIMDKLDQDPSHCRST
jgi:hypothetical protein